MELSTLTINALTIKHLDCVIFPHTISQCASFFNFGKWLNNFLVLRSWAPD
jgi:hypothetical protein